jgi:starch synthase
MYIVHIASEFAPIAKAGGLGDVVHGLAKEQKGLGNDVEVLIPKYDILQYRFIENLHVDMHDLWSYEDSTQYHNSIWKGTVDGISTLFVESHHNQYYFNRGCIYAGFPDVGRFLYFCKTALEYLYKAGKKPDIVHIHDWPTAIVAPLIQDIYRPAGFECGGVVFTLHNIEHQGKCYPSSLSRIGLRGEDYRTEARMQDPGDPSFVNLLKGGIVYSDFLTTVSPRYAEEIKTEEYGFGLHKTVKEYDYKLRGILNGIELETWNPATDTHLKALYPPNATFKDKVLEQKRANKEELLKLLHLEFTPGPLIGSVTRIAKQKGPELLKEAIHSIMHRDGSFVLLGVSSDPNLEKEFEQLRNQYKDTKRLHINLTFNESLARQIYAASDALLIPSLFEPCGLTQMISMRYGTLPIVRKTGGLADTVFDIEDNSISLEKRTGFVFSDPDAHSLSHALDRVYHYYKHEPQKWQQLIENGLNLDLSWKSSATKYQRVYTWALKHRQHNQTLASAS